ncbi:hypothetical protein KA107_01120 [Candidatus Pacearchaeota archaeon]|nr:hypothetical protein [Candidatus Pacearchaeota archaeon]
MVNLKTVIPFFAILLIGIISLSPASKGLDAVVSGNVNLSNGQIASIQINSEQARQNVEARIGRSCDNCSVELVEIVVKGETRASFQVTEDKPSRFLGIFKTHIKTTSNVDAETGAIISVNKPWWAFLAVESKATTEVNSNDKDSTESAETNTGVEVRANENSQPNSKPISEWCVKGQTYSVSQNGSASNTVIEGVVTYKGEQRCKGISKTVIQVPGGYVADIEAITTYYFNEGGKDVWVSSNVNGQTTEVHVTNK